MTFSWAEAKWDCREERDGVGPYRGMQMPREPSPPETFAIAREVVKRPDQTNVVGISGTGRRWDEATLGQFARRARARASVARSGSPKANRTKGAD